MTSARPRAATLRRAVHNSLADPDWIPRLALTRHPRVSRRSGSSPPGLPARRRAARGRPPRLRRALAPHGLPASSASSVPGGGYQVVEITRFGSGATRLQDVCPSAPPDMCPLPGTRRSSREQGSPWPGVAMSFGLEYMSRLAHTRSIRLLAATMLPIVSCGRRGSTSVRVVL